MCAYLRLSIPFTAADLSAEVNAVIISPLNQTRVPCILLKMIGLVMTYLCLFFALSVSSSSRSLLLPQ